MVVAPTQLFSASSAADQPSMGELSGHSFRVGGAVDMLSKGIPPERIMLRGGWKLEITAMRYLRSWQEEYWSQD